jgi:hypothetical protein
MFGSSERFVSPYPNKRQCVEGTPKENESSSFLLSLNEATTTGGHGTPTKGPEVGDALQQRAIALANQGCNVFLTGRAGTGKSWATKRIIEEFAKRNENIYATAPTGIAAINVDGTTIHNWGRFNLGQYCKSAVICYLYFVYLMCLWSYTCVVAFNT